MVVKTLTRAGHTRQYVVREARSGWVVSQIEDNLPVQVVHCSDWHRTERTVNLLLQQIGDLERQGWQVVGAAS
jgi:hypothetical protein